MKTTTIEVPVWYEESKEKSNTTIHNIEAERRHQQIVTLFYLFHTNPYNSNTHHSFSASPNYLVLPRHRNQILEPINANLSLPKLPNRRHYCHHYRH